MPTDHSPDKRRFWQNPLTARLTRRSGCLANKVTIATAAALGLGTSYFLIQETIHGGYGRLPFYFYLLLMIIAVGGILSFPIFAAYVAANLTVRHARSLEYPALCVTAIPSREIVLGYALAALRYCGAPGVLMIGLMPLFTIWLTESVQLWSYYPSTIYDSIVMHADIGAFGIILKWTLIVLVCALGVAGVNFSILAFSVGLSLWWRSAPPAALGALIVAIGGMLLIAYTINQAVALLHITSAFSRHLLQYGLFLPIPYLLAWGAIRSSSRWVRKE